MFKPDFGRVPDYLERTKEQLRREREELDAQLAAREVTCIAFSGMPGLLPARGHMP